MARSTTVHRRISTHSLSIWPWSPRLSSWIGCFAPCVRFYSKGLHDYSSNFTSNGKHSQPFFAVWRLLTNYFTNIHNTPFQMRLGPASQLTTITPSCTRMPSPVETVNGTVKTVKAPERNIGWLGLSFLMCTFFYPLCPSPPCLYSFFVA